MYRNCGFSLAHKEGLDFAVPVFLLAYASRFGSKIRPLQLQRLAVSAPGGATRCPPRLPLGFKSLRQQNKKAVLCTTSLFWRRRRDLNPRASCPTYTLSRGASSPLEYFSKVKMFSLYPLFGADYSFLRPPPLLEFGGESGIRTHVGLHPNGFQDRLVMTASISLQI